MSSSGNNNDPNKQSQQPTFNIPSYGLPSGSGSTAEQLKKKEEGSKFGFGFGEKPSVGGAGGAGGSATGFGSAPPPAPSVSSQSSSLYKPPSTSTTSSEAPKPSSSVGQRAPATAATSGGLLSGVPSKPAPPPASRPEQSFERAEGISSIGAFFNNNVAPRQTIPGLGGTSRIAFDSVGYGAGRSQSVGQGFGNGGKKPVEKAEPVKREEPKKPALQEQPPKPEPVKSFEPPKVEPTKAPERPAQPAPAKKPEVAEPVKKAEAEKKKPEEKVVTKRAENGKKPEQPVKTPTEPAKPAEVKAPKPKAPATKKRPREPSEIRHSTRERKQVHLENIAATAVHHAPVSIPSGRGTKLGDIPHTRNELAKRKSSDAATQQLHRLIYGRAGESGKRKEFLRRFNGFVDEKSVHCPIPSSS